MQINSQEFSIPFCLPMENLMMSFLAFRCILSRRIVFLQSQLNVSKKINSHYLYRQLFQNELKKACLTHFVPKNCFPFAFYGLRHAWVSCKFFNQSKPWQYCLSVATNTVTLMSCFWVISPHLKRPYWNCKQQCQIFQVTFNKNILFFMILKLFHLFWKLLSTALLSLRINLTTNWPVQATLLKK